MNINESIAFATDSVDVKLNTALPQPSQTYSRSDGITVMMALHGRARFEVDFTEYELTANGVITFAPNTTVRLLTADADFRCSVLCVSHTIAVETIPRPEPSFLDFLRRYPLGSIPEQRAETIRHAMSDAAYFLYDNTGDHRMLIVRNIVQNILLEIYDAVKQRFLSLSSKPLGRRGELFIDFIHLVYAHGDKEREVAFYTDKLCITPRYLARIVHDCCGETAKEIIDRHCVQEIKARLRTSNDTLQSIARDFLFPDQSFFTRYFKKQTGLTPSAFRAAEM